MTNTHHLDSILHSEFLQQGRIDPITGEEIEEGHTIVICAACKSAFFIESWEYLGEQHCNQRDTLLEIPISKTLFLEAKPLEYLPFLFKKGNLQNDSLLKSGIENFLLIVAFVMSAIALFVAAILVGFYTTPILGIVAGFAIGGIIAALMHSQKSTTLFKKKVNAKKASYLALNAKKQAITIKKKEVQETISFSDLEQLNYSFNYVRANNADDLHNYSLTLEIIPKNNEKVTYYTILHQDEIPYWSNFLEELPYNLKVLNVR